MERNHYCPYCRQQVAGQLDAAGRVRCSTCRAVLEAFDIFISHASEDRDVADRIAAKLNAAGITYWLAYEQIELGDWFVPRVRDAIKSAKAIVVIVSRAAEQSGWVVRELGYAVERTRPMLPFKIEEFEVSDDFLFLLFGHQILTNQVFETNVDGTIARIHRLLTPFVPDTPTSAMSSTPVPVFSKDWPAEPYVGPGPFEPQTNQQFCGRETETRAFIELLAKHRVVLLYAPSGAGKSSLLNRSIHDTLEAQDLEVLTGARVGGPLPNSLKESQVRNIYTFAAIYNLDKRDNSVERRPNITLADYLKNKSQRAGTRGRVIIFDQFEEMFTKHGERYLDRDDFFDDVIVALNSDKKLRVILAMRKEYLADILPKADKLTDDLKLGIFPLNPLGRNGALEAVTLPIKDYAKFDEGVAESIVDELMMAKFNVSDGVEIHQRSEFVDMVELQIVCNHLWRKLPEGTNHISDELVRKAIGEGRTLSEFAVNALDDFYKETVERVAEASHYSKAFIQLGCMRFVTDSSTRKLVQRNPIGRTGLLPDAIIEQLESLHLLRSEEHGSDRWYELAHDRLAKPVSKQRDSKLRALLVAEELLNRMLEKALAENARRLEGYFVEHRDILNDCKPFHDKPGHLSPDEAEFLFRASLVDGDKETMIAWSERLAVDYPELIEVVLRDAIDTTPTRLELLDSKHIELLDRARRNAARLLGSKLKCLEGLSHELVCLALSDTNPFVRRSAAVSLARLDEPEFYAQIIEKLYNTATASEAQSALANIRVAVDQKLAVEENSKNLKDPKAPAPRFESCFRRIGWLIRCRIFLEAWGNRFAAGPSLFLFIAIPGAVFAAISAAAFKWLPGIFGWSLEQKAASPGMGIFHGLSGGVIWGGSIALGLALFYIVVERQQDKKSTFRPYGAILTGAVFGLISSLFIVLIVVLVFEIESLIGMGWIGSRDVASLSRFEKKYWLDLFVSIRYGWVQLVIGTGMGIGMALATNSLRAWNRWVGFLRRQKRVTSWTQSTRLIRRIIPIAALRVWPVPLTIILAGVLAYFVPHPQQADNSPQEAISVIENNTQTLQVNSKDEKAIQEIARQLERLKVDHVHDRPGFWSKDRKAPGNTPEARQMQLIHGLIADCLSQIVGAFFAIVGMGFGMVIVTHGVSLDPWRN